MDISFQKSKVISGKTIEITGSKSESNRLLLLQALYPQLRINNISNSDDSQLMQKALTSSGEVIDIHHAGTAMRFLTAYFSIQQDREVVLTGSSRMKERPIQILVEALSTLGAKISYLENNGFPPLKIIGNSLTEKKVALKANVSSQYISALLLIAPQLKHGLELTLDGNITSVPYINMTLALLNEIGVETQFDNNSITVKPFRETLQNITLTVESDWSSASYWYSVIALSAVGTEVSLKSYKENSLQGDSILANTYREFGVETRFSDNTITLKKTNQPEDQTIINLDLSNAPDIAQTIAVTAFGLGLKCFMNGLHTLKIKETDRLVALKTELEKLGAKVNITDNSLRLLNDSEINSNITIETYNDHRMAMAFAPLALKVPLVIKDANVVSKSYPQFWDDIESVGFKIK
ncbi:MAG: 3-phosphoshikimate 1-carboxyvinyltransferase [Winogradskyella sp.]|uniref:3-phosphoshikimate 1-carboxyvinyltransferase n=1 Tax=Winogradskyella sp. TaxID=1883156 RepID=UPI0017E319F6|nr:3-phosphoshikimate 1-carboxyvinyltransferase [Winogradskyella sp.]